MTARAWTWFALVACALGHAGPAIAYVRSRTSMGTPIEWRRGCPRFSYHPYDDATLPDERVLAAIQRSVDAWRAVLGGCSRIQIEVAPDGDAEDAIQFDGVNAIVSRPPGFCDDPRHADDHLCLAPDAAAITVIFYYDLPDDSRDGELVEADVELNRFMFELSDDGAPDKVDVQNAMTHELGHALGLDHSCHTILGAAPPVDDRGRETPYCYPIGALPDEVVDSTMFTFAELGETKKRFPGADEAAGVCALYAGHAGVCRGPETTCACATGRRGAKLPLVPAILAIATALALRRRNRFRGRIR